MELTDIVIQTGVVLGAITTISLFIKGGLDKQFKPLYEKMDKKDYEDCKRYLTDFITEIKQGIKKGQKLEEIKSEIQIQMAKDTYDHYIKDKKDGGLGGNSWVQDEWEKIIRGVKNND